MGKTGARVRPSWKPVQDDFQLGACPRRLFGYLSRDHDGTWTAFTEDAEPIIASTDLHGARAALWEWHQLVHEAACEHTALSGTPLQKTVSSMFALSNTSR